MLRRSVVLVVAFVVASLPACAGPDANATLADLPGLRAGLAVVSANDEEAPLLSVSLSYDQEAFVATHGECATLGSVEARIDDRAVELTYPGGPDTDFGGCNSPAFADARLRLEGDAPVVLTFRDASREVRAEYAAADLEPHTPTPIEPATWTLRADADVRVRWSHPADFVDASVYDALWFQLDADGEARQLLPTFSSDEIRFRLPSGLPGAGTGTLFFDFRWAGGPATSCAGADECRYGVHRAHHQRFALAAP